MRIKLKHIAPFAFMYIMLRVIFSLPEADAQTQVYPVSVTTQITPPYSVNLADYAAPGCEQMKVIVLQRDLTQSPYRLYLKMEIELNGRTIVRTSPNYVPAAFILEPGIPTLLSGSSLAPYFDPANMEFTGISREQYIRTKLFPEGAYVITFTAYDWARRDVALSHGGAFFCYLAKTDPPTLNLPLNNAMVQYSSPQYINFQWLSRNVASPNSAFSTRYRLELFEMRVGGISPSEIVTGTRPFFTAETDRTSLVYSIPQPVLEKGMRYVWRVKAFDTGGKDFIRNNGFSEVFSFVYGEGEGGIMDFSAVGNFVAKAVSPRKAKLTWDASSAYNSYRIYYRKKGSVSKWYESETAQNSAEINGLAPGSIYECKVQGKRGNAWGSFSVMDTVGMPLIPVIECGSPFTPLEVTNRQPLLELMRLQEFDAGGFMVTIADPYALTTAPGRFSGKGFVQVPLFGHKKIRCEFTNIFINTDFRMVEGSIRLITDSNDGKNAMWDIDEVFEGGSDNGRVIEGTEEVSLIIPDVVIPNAGSIILDTAAAEILVVNEFRDTIRIDVGSMLQENPKNLTVKDSGGNLYSLDTQTGKATSLGKVPPSGSAQQLATLPSVVDTRKGMVTFTPIPGQTRFAFDVRKSEYAISNLFSEKYKTMPMEDGGLYDIPYKLIPVGETDVVLAKVEIKNKSIKPDSIVFRSGTGTVYKAQKSGKEGEYLLTLPSGKVNDGIEVNATYTDSKGRVFVLGRMIVLSYEYRKPKLVLVPVNGNGVDTDPAAIKSELDKVYMPVAVDWQVSPDKSNFEAYADSLDIKGSGMFSMYTEGMKALNNAFIIHKGADFDPSALYLFMLQVSGEESATGDMPRGKQFGYVFTRTAGTAEALNRTIAHEIAHGAFSLSHTFDSKYDIPQGSTGNLLDYTAGTDLVKHQWDAIHDPGLVLGMFERDEDGMMLGEITYIFIANQIYNSGEFSLKSPEVFITPAGKPFLNKHIKQAKFAGTETNWIKSSEPSKLFLPAGCLVEFTLNDNKSFRSVFKKNKAGSWYFSGYYPSERCSEKGFFEDSKLYAECDKIAGSYSASLYIDNFKKNVFANASYVPRGAGLLQVEIVNSISQHSLDYTKFSARDWAIYNYYGDGSTLIKLANDRYILFYIDQFGSEVWFEWNGSMWTALKEPLPPTMKETYEKIFTREFFVEVGTELGHAVFDVVSSATGIGLIIASGNTLWYIAEGDLLSAGLSLATVIPGGAIVKRVGLLVKESTGSVKLISYSAKVAKFIEAYGSTYEGAIKNAIRKVPDEKLEFIIASIQKLDASLQEQFLKDLNQNLNIIEDSQNLLASNIDKIDDKLIEAWKILNEAGETALRSNISELEKVIANIDDIKNSGGYKIWITKLSKFTAKQIDEYVLLATKNSNAKKVMLGKYGDGGPTSYVQRAGNDHTYFDMGQEKWEEAASIVKNNTDEMWKINKQFIDEQKALGKEFYFSHEPWKAQTHEYLSKEAEYLIDLGAKDFVKINDNTWMVIW